MILPDVNVLIYVHREDADRHPEYLAWFEKTLSGDEPFGLADIVLSSFVRIVTHPRVFAVPTPLSDAIEFVEVLRQQPLAVPVNPGPRQWGIFRSLCRDSDARGNLVADAYLAAIAIEHGCEWITTDRDFSRFPKLRFRHPLS